MSRCPSSTHTPRGQPLNSPLCACAVQATRPHQIPWFVEQGGPGDTTIGVFVNLVLPMKSPGLINIFKGRDLLFVEERGTRYSRPFCRVLRSTPTTLRWPKVKYRLRTRVGSGRATRASRPVESIPTLSTPAKTPLTSFMWQKPWVIGSSTSTAASYGTLLGQYVTAQSGQHKATLRSAILDGVVLAGH